VFKGDGHLETICSCTRHGGFSLRLTLASLDKQPHGDLEGTSKGQMLAARTAVEG